MRTLYLFIFLLISAFSFAQGMEKRLGDAVKKLEADDQFKHAVMSLYVEDGKTGKLIYEKNAELGLAPASCQKLVTCVTAFTLLGHDFHYTTYIGTDPSANKNYDAGSLFIIGQGDPTLGSWRWKDTRDSSVLSGITAILKKNKLTRFERNLYVEDDYYGLQVIPDGWIWQDIGNYYGAACFGFNWHENQYDLVLQPGMIAGLPTTVVAIEPRVPDLSIINHITTGAKGSGDNGYIYTSPFSNFAITSGTIPAQEEKFTISGSMPNPSKVFKNVLVDHLFNNGINMEKVSYANSGNILSGKPVYKAMRIVDSLISPPLDSINYWFLKRSINLYGEALFKSLAKKYHPFISPDKIYDSAVSLVKIFWSKNGIDPSALNIIDGCGLSPANRVTTHALVTILQFAKKQDWYSSFLEALPLMNGIKMKDGYINGVRSFTGYIKSRAGMDYTFSFIVNNFNGSAGTVREKIWRLLDILK